MLLRLAAVALLATALVACGSSKKAAQAGDLPPGCTVPEADRIVSDFLATPTFAPPAEFRSYRSSETDNRSFATTSAAKALAHLRVRRAHGERDRLLSLRVAKDDFNHVTISLQLTRFALDFAARGIHTRVATGTGTLDCAHQKVAAWTQRGP